MFGQMIFLPVCDRIINDFIALTMFWGNDFVPEAPGQNIRNGMLYDAMKWYQDTYLNELPFEHLLDKELRLDYTRIS